MSVNEVRLKKASTAFQVLGGVGDSSSSTGSAPSGQAGGAASASAASQTFRLGDEDHTLGNALRHVLMQDSQVDFAAYSVPHPSEPAVQIRVQTSAAVAAVAKNAGIKGDSAPPPPPAAIDRLKTACQTLSEQCNIVLDAWEEQFPDVREDRIRMDRILLEEDGEIMAVGAADHDDDAREMED